VTHSVIADQWDFEIRINKEDRNVEQLKKFVRIIWKVRMFEKISNSEIFFPSRYSLIAFVFSFQPLQIITDCEDFILEKYPDILLKTHPTVSHRLPKEITFITSQELHEMFPEMDVHQRESAAVRKYGATFIIGMGWPMADGSQPEEVRAPGYDDWNFNGDIITYVSTSIMLPWMNANSYR
jgi:aspartate--ammonia ligase